MNGYLISLLCLRWHAVRELAPGGDLLSSQTFHFEFKSVEMEQDSYRGNVSRLGYKLRVVISRSFGGSIVRDYPFWVRNVTPPESLPDDLSISQPIKVIEFSNS